ncbi:glycine cleavage system aminomethyltransferase GcvT [Paracoccaceae bacterium]|nr:glycine cleavage system aminomethyltransferase GcvT [Paracoccaceae bacterium]
MTELKKTALCDLHRSLGAKSIPFAGYEMPVNYPLGIMKEHLYCRKSAGLFDVSHMGQLVISSNTQSMQFIATELEKLLPIDMLGLGEDRQRYGFLLNKEGGIIDDLMISNRGDHYFAVINASRKEIDFKYFKENISREIDVDLIKTRALIAIQGPQSEKILSDLIGELSFLKYLDVKNFSYKGETLWVSRSGYTGQDGFEISLPNSLCEVFCKNILEQDGIEPIGLGARDTLRLECGLCLYGQDLNETITPIEAGLKWAIQKVRRTGGEREGGFVGQEKILKQIEEQPYFKREAFFPDGRAPIRSGTKLFSDDNGKNEIGVITSGGYSPSLERPISMGYLHHNKFKIGNPIFGELRTKFFPIKLTKLPFVTTSFKRN